MGELGSGDVQEPIRRIFNSIPAFLPLNGTEAVNASPWQQMLGFSLFQDSAESNEQRRERTRQNPPNQAPALFPQPIEGQARGPLGFGRAELPRENRGRQNVVYQNRFYSVVEMRNDNPQNFSSSCRTKFEHIQWVKWRILGICPVVWMNKEEIRRHMVVEELHEIISVSFMKQQFMRFAIIENEDLQIFPSTCRRSTSSSPVFRLWPERTTSGCRLSREATSGSPVFRLWPKRRTTGFRLFRETTSGSPVFRLRPKRRTSGFRLFRVFDFKRRHQAHQSFDSGRNEGPQASDFSGNANNMTVNSSQRQRLVAQVAPQGFSNHGQRLNVTLDTHERTVFNRERDPPVAQVRPQQRPSFNYEGAFNRRRHEQGPRR
ncbi:unnamed protein product [Caenorhabditis auriculariae]|uniref:Uncharacterized protein n=1 Tax=Caenorhabditis auriculariae TaxID=2777116 RepID=A0A8S1GZG0_9PELO|nr:unnamed protein product [Caenorhabditis auriculariae]